MDQISMENLRQNKPAKTDPFWTERSFLRTVPSVFLWDNQDLEDA